VPDRLAAARRRSGTEIEWLDLEQVALLTTVASAAVLREESDQDAQLRARCRVHAEERHRPKWELAIEMLDELAEWGLRPPVVVSDAGYGEITEFGQALAGRAIAYVLQVIRRHERPWARRAARVAAVEGTRQAAHSPLPPAAYLAA